MALSTEHGLVMYRAMATIIRAWASIGQRGEQGPIEQMRQGLAACQTTGAQLMRPHFLALLADAYGRVGQAEAGLKMLAEALAVVDRTEARMYEAELYRLKGELMLLQPSREGEEASGRDAAEACFLQAIAIARRQGARSLELRAAMGLGRLWQQQGKSGDARQMLAETYGWFTEGFDTVDLQEARVLLGELH